jgi:predicted O-linked N-acetylglucosamine transferase (SPINDLY family)
LAGWLLATGLGELVAENTDALLAKAVDLASPETRHALTERLNNAVQAERRDGAARRAKYLTEALGQLLLE